MLKKTFLKTAALAAAVLLMSGTAAQAQSDGAQTPGAAAAAGAYDSARPDGATSGMSGSSGRDDAGADATTNPSGAGMGMGSGTNSGMGMDSGAGTSDDAANTGSAAGMSPQADPYAKRHLRRSRATVTPNIVNDNVYPDPRNPGREDPAIKARRDAKRTMRSGSDSSNAPAGDSR